MSTRSLFSFLCGIVLVLTAYMGSDFTYAQSEIRKLQDQIEQKNERLSEIEKEIAQYETALLQVGAEKNTLQNAINQLELERKKVNADISYTENKITSTDLEINKLILEINATEKDIIQNEEAIRKIIRSMHITDEESLVEIFLRQQNISELWVAFENLETVKTSISEKVKSLSALKDVLEEKKIQNTARRGELLSLKERYDDQNNVLANNQNTKATLLNQTKNEESNYQRLLREKEAARDTLLSEVRDIESQIQFILDPNTIPAPGTPVFTWPLKNPYITQYFGYTKFALSGAYNGSKHNGMDLGAPFGTPISAPLTGTVRMTGNTDTVPGCYSWGKWLLIDHPNGLSSMFAHMSQVAVVPGQKVDLGDTVGYIGSTGYSTGPHLHYTLYVTEGVSIKKFNEFKAVTGCGAALSPFAAVEAYLDPLEYLPPL